MEDIKQVVYSRELRLSEVMAIGLQLFGKNIRTVLLGVLCLGIPISLLVTIIQMRLMGFYDVVDAILTQDYAISQAQLYEAMSQLFIYQILAMAIDAFLVPIFMLGIAKATKWRLEGKQKGYSGVFAQAMLFEPTLVKVGIVYMISLIFGAFLFFPFVYLSVSWCFYVFCIGLGKRKGLDALGHSLMLVRGRWWKTFGYLFVMGVVMFLGNSLLNMVFANIMSMMANNQAGVTFAMNALYIACTYFVNGLFASMMTIFYLNRESGLFGMQALEEEIAE